MGSTYGCTSVRLVRSACTSFVAGPTFLGAFVTRAYVLGFYVVWGIAERITRLGLASPFLIP